MKRTIFVFIFVASTLSAFSLDFSGTRFAVRGERAEADRSYLVLTHEDAGELLFAAEGSEEPAEALKTLDTFLSVLHSFTSLETAELRAQTEPEGIRLSVLPRRFAAEGLDLLPFIPGGLQFFLKNGVEYDFRVKSGSFFIRLRGVFTSEDDLLSDSLAAIRDPLAYLATRDPQYALRRISELEKRLADNEKSLAALALQLAAEASRAEAQREIRLSALEDALMAALNKGLFGGPKPIKPELVAKIIELRAADPSLDRAGMAEKLKAGGMSASSKEIDIVYRVKIDGRP